MAEEKILFEDYLKEQLNPEEKAQFEQRLNDSEFRKSFEEYKSIRNAMIADINIKGESALRENLEKLGSQYFNVEKKETKLVDIRSKFSALRVAASILLLLGVSFSFLYLNKSKYSDSNLADKYFNKHSSYTTRGGDQVQKNRRKAVQFADANKLFEEGKYRQAQTMYNSLLLEKGTFSQLAEWNLLMIQLKNDKEGDHKRILNRILKNPDHRFHYKALELEKDLNIFYRKLP